MPTEKPRLYIHQTVNKTVYSFFHRSLDALVTNKDLVLTNRREAPNGEEINRMEQVRAKAIERRTKPGEEVRPDIVVMRKFADELLDEAAAKMEIKAEEEARNAETEANKVRRQAKVEKVLDGAPTSLDSKLAKEITAAKNKDALEKLVMDELGINLDKRQSLDKMKATAFDELAKIEAAGK